jgi:hypothetical protein
MLKVVSKRWKDPDEEKIFGFDWNTKYLKSTDIIASSIWILPSGLVEVSKSNTTTTTKIKLGGGTLGETYTITNRITTVTSGETLDQELQIVIE